MQLRQLSELSVTVTLSVGRGWVQRGDITARHTAAGCPRAQDASPPGSSANQGDRVEGCRDMATAQPHSPCWSTYPAPLRACGQLARSVSRSQSPLLHLGKRWPNLGAEGGAGLLRGVGGGPRSDAGARAGGALGWTVRLWAVVTWVCPGSGSCSRTPRDVRTALSICPRSHTVAHPPAPASAHSARPGPLTPVPPGRPAPLGHLQTVTFCQDLHERGGELSRAEPLAPRPGPLLSQSRARAGPPPPKAICTLSGRNHRQTRLPPTPRPEASTSKPRLTGDGHLSPLRPSSASGDTEARATSREKPGALPLPSQACARNGALLGGSSHVTEGDRGGCAGGGGDRPTPAPTAHAGPDGPLPQADG